jgi:hypothetical protein
LGHKQCGMFIEQITFQNSSEGEEVDAFDWVTKTEPDKVVTGFIDVKTVKEISSLTVANTPRTDKFTSADFYKLPLTVTSFYYKDTDNVEQTFVYETGSTDKIEAGQALNLTSVASLKINNGVTKGWGEISLDISKAIVSPAEPLVISQKKVAPTGQTTSLTSPYINYVTLAQSKETYNGADQVDLTYDVNISSLSSEVSYSNDVVIPASHKHLYASFLQPNQAKTARVSPQNKNRLTYLDGVVCLCDDSGRPVGMDVSLSSTTEMRGMIGDFNSITNIYLEKNSNFASDGLVYGFYDLAAKKFLGTNISYSEYLEKDGAQNIYIAVLVTDYDGNTVNDDMDYAGFQSIPITNINVPNKLICPIYNIKFKNKTAIQLQKPQSSLSKKNPWHVGVSSGSFTKTYKLDLDKIYNEDIFWLKQYALEDENTCTVKAFYDTTNFNNVGWSKILGKPYVDVKQETPIIIDSTSIKLRQIPFAVIHEPSDNLSYFASPIKPFVFVYIKNTTTNNWDLVPFSEIASFNNSTGYIEFKSAVVPNDIRSIKVDYAVASSAVPIKVLDKKDIKLNPFLFKDDIQMNKPIYFYLEPRSILVENSSSIQVVNNDNIENENTLKYTKNGDVFDPSHPNYNPLNILLCTVYVSDYNFIDTLKVDDLRLKGGGVSSVTPLKEILDNYPEVRSNWDIMGPDGYAYSNGGYVVIQLPENLKTYMSNAKIKETISAALTAGVVYDLQNYSGEDWYKTT